MEIGTRLREAREAKNLTLEDVQKITKIQTRYLQAIEVGNFDVMPGNFYTRAFIKEYAGAVGIDGEALMEEHKNELPGPTDEVSIQYTRVQRSKQNTSPKNPAIFSFLPTLAVALLIVGIIFAIWYFYRTTDDPVPSENNGEETVDEVFVSPTDETLEEGNGGQSENAGEENGGESDETEGDQAATEEEPSEEEEEPAEPTLTLTDQGTQGGSQTRTYEFVNPEEDITIEFQTESSNWLEVYDGEGNQYYWAEFAEADSPMEQDLTGAEQIELRFGNPDALEITINGVTLELPEDTNNVVQEVQIDVQSPEE